MKKGKATARKQQSKNQKKRSNQGTKVQTGKSGIVRNVRISRGRSSFSMTDTAHRKYGNGVRIRGTDWLGDLPAAGDVPMGTVMLDQECRPDAFPGTRLTQLAPLWERYCVRLWKFSYFPAVSAILPGQLVAYPEYDPLDLLSGTPDARIRQAFAAMDSVVFNVYDEASVAFTRVDPYTDLYTDFREDDVRLSSIGRFVLMNSVALSVAEAGISLGSIMMTYDIDFYIPQIGIPSVLSPPNLGTVAIATPKVTDLDFATVSDQEEVYVRAGSNVPIVELVHDEDVNPITDQFQAGDILTAVFSAIPALTDGAIVWDDNTGEPPIKAGDTLFLKFLQHSVMGSANDEVGGGSVYATKPGYGHRTPFAAVYATLEDAFNGYGSLSSLANRNDDASLHQVYGTTVESDSEISWSSGSTGLPWATKIGTIILTSLIPRRSATIGGGAGILIGNLASGVKARQRAARSTNPKERRPRADNTQEGGFETCLAQTRVVGRPTTLDPDRAQASVSVKTSPALRCESGCVCHHTYRSFPEPGSLCDSYDQMKSH
jgi:hypothetical protein